MKIYLKNNWSEQFVYGDKNPGYFIGRRKEIDSLKSILLENDTGSVLISSVRGVGKHLLFIRFCQRLIIIKKAKFFQFLLTLDML